MHGASLLVDSNGQCFLSLIPTRLSESVLTSSMLHQHNTSVSTLCSLFCGIGQSLRCDTIHTVLSGVKRLSSSRMAHTICLSPLSASLIASLRYPFTSQISQ